MVLLIWLRHFRTNASPTQITTVDLYLNRTGCVHLASYRHQRDTSSSRNVTYHIVEVDVCKMYLFHFFTAPAPLSPRKPMKAKCHEMLKMEMRSFRFFCRLKLCCEVLYLQRLHSPLKLLETKFKVKSKQKILRQSGTATSVMSGHNVYYIRQTSCILKDFSCIKTVIGDNCGVIPELFAGQHFRMRFEFSMVVVLMRLVSIHL